MVLRDDTVERSNLTIEVSRLCRGTAHLNVTVIFTEGFIAVWENFSALGVFCP